MMNSILRTELNLPGSEKFIFRHDLSPVLAARAEVPLTPLQLPSGPRQIDFPSPFPAQAAVDFDARLPGSFFARAHFASPQGLTWERVILSQTGRIAALIDTFVPCRGSIPERKHQWLGEEAGWQWHTFGAGESGPASSADYQVWTITDGSGKDPKVDLADGRLLRLARRRDGTLIGLGHIERETEVRNIRVRAEAFWLSESGFFLANGTELGYLGRKIIEAEEPVCMEYDMTTGFGTIQGTGESILKLHGGNSTFEVQVRNGRTEIDITGLARKSDWWNVVMAAVQKL